MFLYANQNNVLHRIIVTLIVTILSYFKMWKAPGVNYCHIFNPTPKWLG